MKTITRRNTVNTSVSLTHDNVRIIESMTRRIHANRSAIINAAIRMYADTQLAEDLKQGYLDDRADNQVFAADALVLFSEGAGK